MDLQCADMPTCRHADTPTCRHADTPVFLVVYPLLAYSTSLSHGDEPVMRTLLCASAPVIYKVDAPPPNRNRGRVAIVLCIHGLVRLSTRTKSICFELIERTFFAATQVFFIFLHAEHWRSCQCDVWEVFFREFYP